MENFGGDAYLNTRVSLFANRLFTQEQNEQLSKLDLDEIGRLYGLDSLQEQGRGLPAASWLRAVENTFLRTLLSELEILVRPMDENARTLVMQWARKFGIFNLKALIRGKLNGLSETEIQESLQDLPSYLSLPYETLLRSESVLEMLRQLEKGGHQDIAGQARQVYEKHGEPFLLEAAIDRRYFTTMNALLEGLGLTDYKDVKHVVGLQMDRVNLLLLLRYRFSYNQAASETYYQLMPSPGLLNKLRLLNMLKRDTFDGVLEALPTPLTNEMAGATDASEVERRMYAFTSYELKRVLRCSSSGVARALAYLTLRELDLKRLFTVVQKHLLQLGDAVTNLALGVEPDSKQGRKWLKNPICKEI